jgi:hypothetical protein
MVVSMSELYRFKGGKIFLNSGGQGPDDYMLKPTKGGRWTRVIFRWGRHWTGDKVAMESDRTAMEKILPVPHMCVQDCRAWYEWHKSRGSLVTMNATEFWEKYKDYPEVRVR